MSFTSMIRRTAGGYGAAETGQTELSCSSQNACMAPRYAQSTTSSEHESVDSSTTVPRYAADAEFVGPPYLGSMMYTHRDPLVLSPNPQVSPDIRLFDTNFEGISAQRTQEAAERADELKKRDRWAKDKLAKQNLAKVVQLLDQLHLPDDEYYRKHIERIAESLKTSASDTDLQNVAAIHRALMLRVMTSNVDKIKTAMVDPSKLVVKLKEKALGLLVGRQLAIEDEQSLLDLISRATEGVDGKSGTSDLNVEAITKLVSLVQGLGRQSASGMIDDKMLQEMDLPKDEEAAQKFDRVQRDRLYKKAFKAEFGKVLGANANDRVAERFSPRQRAELLQFFATRMIPRELFTGETEKIALADKSEMSHAVPQDVGADNVELRLAMSAHMLLMGNAHGKTYASGWIHAKPAARFCGHWVNWVWHYAGLNPGKFTLASYPAPHSTAQLNAVGPTNVLSFGRGEISRDAKHPHEYLKPGAWIMIANANPTGYHSMLFMGWTSKKNERGIPIARFFHQPFPGDIGTVQSGGYYTEEPMPDLRQTDRVSDGMPARSAEELFEHDNGNPITSSTAAQKAKAASNIGDTATFVKINKLDSAKLWEQLSERALALINQPRENTVISEPQKEIFLRLWNENRFMPNGNPLPETLARLIALIQKVTLKAPTGKLDASLHRQLASSSETK